jgi:mannose-6-phosphate isomerase-like protein (cupin superfamily)
MRRRYLLVVCFGAYAALSAAERSQRKVDPTFLRHYVPELQSSPADVSTSSCQYTAIFGAGDPESRPSFMRGIARFGEIAVVSGGACKPVVYSTEEQVYVVMNGGGQLRYGEETHPIKAHDFMYLPAGIEHSLANDSGTELRVFAMGFKVEPGTKPPARLMIANLNEIRRQTVSGHPDTVTYQLMMGNLNSKRDRLAAGHLLTSLYTMEFQPGGTNFPHHHDSEEEIYYVMDGEGEMVAGGGMDGIEGRHPARAGDAYFFRENCTVGFYNSNAGMAHILAVRSVFPRDEGPRYIR